MDADGYLALDDSLKEEEEETALESDTTTCTESDDASSNDEDPENRPVPHREALNASQQLATYIFAHNIEFRDVCEIIEKYRQLLNESMGQQQ
ncbi:hypothetical protein PRIC1_002562 [Phytophthora ramorum]|uniref:uncharacterized protein n=1 Tax=Phytophthora ramorum TaxID=164328 RepID=UPI0030B06C80|nr:hypothetical protein KRP23_882 [Phytophthora ramorum]